MQNIIYRITFLFLIIICLSACKSYRNRILFKTDVEVVPGRLALAVQDAEGNYTIQENDFLELNVYTNEGEVIIDPNNEILREFGGGGGQNTQNQEKLNPNFLVRADGYAKLPVIGDIGLAGFTLKQADSLLEREYSAYYEGVFVITRYVNKRVIVLGSTGGQVIPLQNENTNLIEILGLAGGVGLMSKVNKIRLIRGDLNDPEVRIIDLSTIDGMKSASLKIQPNDIIYVEPVQRITNEAIRDITPILSLITSMITLIVLIRNL